MGGSKLPSRLRGRFATAPASSRSAPLPFRLRSGSLLSLLSFVVAGTGGGSRRRTGAALVAAERQDQGAPSPTTGAGATNERRANVGASSGRSASGSRYPLQRERLKVPYGLPAAVAAVQRLKRERKTLHRLKAEELSRLEPPAVMARALPWFRLPWASASMRADGQARQYGAPECRRKTCGGGHAE